ncbi:hypothetical protein J2X11_000273 [Aeromicrobium panaciterrae]|uniref:Uncharacterized protein n=1 Tax=Aeromicrobium panaciterrae TaxID=363861 RepID=A0ABU1UJS7_9ACTN|nr:hypothetical protein [Aeromicrobium panaciterrae]MDR7085434.1 hypothetical protein [Aeromicrobium panaciterrae]
MTDRPDPLTTPIRDAATLTITLFGDNGRIDHALSAELGRRGCRTHAVSVETGWLKSAENVICRLDTVAGQRALEGLAGRVGPHATVIAVCEQPANESDAKRLQDLCKACGRHHDVSLIWHSPVGDAPASEPPPIEHLAVSIVDEVSTKVAHTDGNSFTTRFVDLG